MSDNPHMEYELVYTEIVVDGKTKGFAFHDKDTTYIRYQIAAPNENRKTWHAIEVCRGGDDPFEFVHLGYAKSRKSAFSMVRKAYTAFVLQDAYHQHRRKIEERNDD